MLEDTFIQWHIYIFLASCCYAGWVSTVCGRSTSGSHSYSRNADNYVTIYKNDCKPHWKRPWCWERLKAGGEGDNRGRDGWMASLTQWTWANSRSWWWTGRPGVLQFMGSQRVGHNWATELKHYKPQEDRHLKEKIIECIFNKVHLWSQIELGVKYKLNSDS